MNDKKNILVISFQSLSANSGQGMARLGYYLSAELHKQGMLKEFIVSSKGKYNTPFPSKPVSSLSKYYLFALNKLYRFLGIKEYTFRYIQELLFDRLCALKINSSVTHIIATNSYLYHTFKKAKKKGIKIYLVPANPEDNFIYNLVKEEQEKLDIHFTDAYTYLPRLNYYNKSVAFTDKIICCTAVTTETYTSHHGKEKIAHIPGHLKPDFKPTKPYKPALDGDYNICYVAHTQLLKGLHYLLEAWQHIMQREGTGNMHLYIGGELFDTMNGYIKHKFAKLRNVHYSGNVNDVPGYLKGKHLFIAPSLVEGGPVTALEAAHYGVPVVLTRNCGSRDFFEDPKNGWVVQIRDAHAIEEAIMWAYYHKEAAAVIGINAKKQLDNYKMEGLISAIAKYAEQH